MSYVISQIKLLSKPRKDGALTLHFSNGRVLRTAAAPESGLVEQLRNAKQHGARVMARSMKGIISECFRPISGRVTEVIEKKSTAAVTMSGRNDVFAVPAGANLAALAKLLKRAQKKSTFVTLAVAANKNQINDVIPMTKASAAARQVYVADALPAPVLPSVKKARVDKKAASLRKRTCKIATWRNPRARVCIPFLFAASGCEVRAHEMCTELDKAGITAGKMWAFAKDIKHLLDVEVPGPSGRVQWILHVAPVINVDGVLIILDPSLYDDPVPCEQWLSRLGRNVSAVALTERRVYQLNKRLVDNKWEFEIAPNSRAVDYELRGLAFEQARREVVLANLAKVANGLPGGVLQGSQNAITGRPILERRNVEQHVGRNALNHKPPN